MKINAIITAGGTSQRYGSKNKLFEPLKGSCVIVEAIKPFLETEGVSKVIVGIETSYADELAVALDLAGLSDEKRIVFSSGGKTRAKTVRNALISVDDDADYILVHDGARPFVTQKLICEVIESAITHSVALPLAPMTDAMVDITKRVQPVDRNNFRRVQTPFCATRDILTEAYMGLDDTEVSNPIYYDDLSVIRTAYRGDIGVVDGDMRNIKITYPSDLSANAEAVTGCGYDIHRLCQGDGIKLLGVKIPCEHSFVAHSDGDVPVHALMDAILSAIGEKDIGHFFPTDDPLYDNADSIDLLKTVLSLARQKGYRVSNISVSIIAERPRIASYIDNMCTNMSAILNLPESKIGITATTNEEVGEIGDSKAIAAYATVLLEKSL